MEASAIGMVYFSTYFCFFSKWVLCLILIWQMQAKPPINCQTDDQSYEVVLVLHLSTSALHKKGMDKIKGNSTHYKKK